MADPAAPDQEPTDQQDQPTDEVTAEMLVEEVSIDGMCGVY